MAIVELFDTLDAIERNSLKLADAITNYSSSLDEIRSMLLDETVPKAEILDFIEETKNYIKREVLNARS